MIIAWREFVFSIHAQLFPRITTLNAALEIRVYALVILISSLLLLFLYNGYLTDLPNKNAKIWYIIFSILGLYTQYYIGFLLVANAFVLLIMKRWRIRINTAAFLKRITGFFIMLYFDLGLSHTHVTKSIIRINPDAFLVSFNGFFIFSYKFMINTLSKEM